MSSDQEVYNALKIDMLAVYNTQLCGVIIEDYNPDKYYPCSYSYHKRNRLRHSLYRKKNMPYALLRFVIKLILFPSILALVLWVAYLLQDTILGILLGYLCAQILTLLNMMINDSIECPFVYERFSKFKKVKKQTNV